MGVLAIFSTGTYAIIGMTCVESEICYEKYHKKICRILKFIFFILNVVPFVETFFLTTFFGLYFSLYIIGYRGDCKGS